MMGRECQPFYIIIVIMGNSGKNIQRISEIIFTLAIFNDVHRFGSDSRGARGQPEWSIQNKSNERKAGQKSFSKMHYSSKWDSLIV